MSCRIASSLLILTLSACAAPPKGRPAGPPPTYEQLRETHNARIEHLARVHGTGVVELEWTEDGKGHFEQGDAELWLSMPRRTALRISKLGDTLLWIGSDPDRYWYFNLLEDPTRLSHRGHDEPLEEGGTPIRPLVLLTAMGLTPLPPVSDPDFPPAVSWDVGEDGKDGGWMIAVPPAVDADEQTWMVFDAQGRWPVQVIVRNDQGDVVVRSVLDDYVTVPTPGMSPLAAPKMTGAARISDPASDSEIRLYLREWTCDVEHQPMDTVFDLDKLTRSMRPEVIE